VGVTRRLGHRGGVGVDPDHERVRASSRERQDLPAVPGPTSSATRA
jgi:hypothetical protein